MPLGQNGVDTVGNKHINWNNIAPRVGLLSVPMDKTVIRGGYGINYYQGPLNFYAASLLSNFGLASGGFGTGFATAGSFGQLPNINTLVTGGSTSAVPAPNSPLVFGPNNMRTPYVQNFDFLVQQDLGYHGIVLSVGYVGNLGRELPYSLETNAAAPGTGSEGPTPEHQIRTRRQHGRNLDRPPTAARSTTAPADLLPC